MGTVYAKANQNAMGEGLFEFEEPLEMEGERTPKPPLKLNGVRARVDKVHVDGLSRTKDDIIKDTINELFHATDFEEVIIKAHKVRRALDSMGCFKDISVLIDVSSGPGATPEGLEVTFQVKELRRIVGGVNTTVSENEGNLVLGVKMPNVLGRGERVQAEYSFGYRNTSNFNITAVKPFPHKPLVPVISTSVYQQNHEYPWSGYRLLDRGILLDLAFNSSLTTKHNLQWEGLIREVSPLSKTTSFKVRESSGPQMKSMLRHIVTVDHRDQRIFPTKGSRVQFSNELSGLGGGVAYIKSELHAQTNVSLTSNIVMQMTMAAGVLHDVFGTELVDHFYLGGPTSFVRGFRQRGLGPHTDDQATGGKMYGAAGFHLYAPLPFVSRGGLGDLFRSHLFVTAGCLPEIDAAPSLAQCRVSCGAGMAVNLGSVARLELNYCVPLRALPGDHPMHGLQAGLAADLL